MISLATQKKLINDIQAGKTSNKCLKVSQYSDYNTLKSSSLDFIDGNVSSENETKSRVWR